jgi:hypothetical protein
MHRGWLAARAGMRVNPCRVVARSQPARCQGPDDGISATGHQPCDHSDVRLDRLASFPDVYFSMTRPSVSSQPRMFST